MVRPAIDFPGFDYRSAFLPRDEADSLFRAVREDIAWRQESIRLFGRQVLQPRLTAWFADPGVRYAYSGLDLSPKAFPPVLDKLRHSLQLASGHEFNAVLLNAYRDGRDSMGWHADDEAELGPAPVIASISVGAVRNFRVRARGGGRSVALPLAHGSLLLMSGDSQKDFQHAVPKTRKPVGLRVNLTFRRVFQ